MKIKSHSKIALSNSGLREKDKDSLMIDCKFIKQVR